MMPKVEVIRPNRSEKRYFTSCDAARVCRNVVHDQGLPREVVLACVAKGLGYTHVSLKTPAKATKIGLDGIEGLVAGTVTAGELGLPAEIGALVGWLIRRLGPIGLGALLATILAYLIDWYQSMQRVESIAITDVLKGFDSCKCKSDTTGYT